jgi:hypothetical protein
MDTQQHRRRGRRFGLFCVEQRVPLGLHSLDLLEQQFEELCRNLGDGVNQAADISWFTTSIPSRNVTPRTTFGN